MAGDSSYNSVVLLLHGDGSNGSTTFTDYSSSPKTVTATGGAQVSTSQSKFGGASMYFDGSGDYLSVADHADLTLGSSNFTVEAWVRLSGYASNNGGVYAATIVSKDAAAGREFSFKIVGTASSFTALDFVGHSDNAAGYTQISSAYTFSLNTWYHLAAVRSGNLLYLFVDGVLLNPGGTAFSRTIQNTTTTLKVGALAFDATYLYYLNGYVDDLRITKGVARYTSDFTPHTVAHSNGLGEVEGVVYDDTNTPCARTVRLYRRDTGALVISGTSDASTGAYRLATPTLDEVQRIVLDDSGGTLYNDIIDRVIPA